MCFNFFSLLEGLRSALDFAAKYLLLNSEALSGMSDSASSREPRTLSGRCRSRTWSGWPQSELYEDDNPYAHLPVLNDVQYSRLFSEKSEEDMEREFWRGVMNEHKEEVREREEHEEEMEEADREWVASMRRVYGRHSSPQLVASGNVARGMGPIELEAREVDWGVRERGRRGLPNGLSEKDEQSGDEDKSGEGEEWYENVYARFNFTSSPEPIAEPQTSTERPPPETRAQSEGDNDYFTPHALPYPPDNNQVESVLEPSSEPPLTWNSVLSYIINSPHLSWAHKEEINARLRYFGIDPTRHNITLENRRLVPNVSRPLLGAPFADHLPYMLEKYPAHAHQQQRNQQQENTEPTHQAAPAAELEPKPDSPTLPNGIPPPSPPPRRRRPHLAILTTPDIHDPRARPSGLPRPQELHLLLPTPPSTPPSPTTQIAINEGTIATQAKLIHKLHVEIDKLNGRVEGLQRELEFAGDYVDGSVVKMFELLHECKEELEGWEREKKIYGKIAEAGTRALRGARGRGVELKVVIGLIEREMKMRDRRGNGRNGGLCGWLKHRRRGGKKRKEELVASDAAAGAHVALPDLDEDAREVVPDASPEPLSRKQADTSATFEEQVKAAHNHHHHYHHHSGRAFHAASPPGPSDSTLKALTGRQLKKLKELEQQNINELDDDIAELGRLMRVSRLQEKEDDDDFGMVEECEEDVRGV